MPFVPDTFFPDGVASLLGRTWQLLAGPDPTAAALATDLAAALVRQPAAASLHNALGLAVVCAGQGQGRLTRPVVEQAATYFQRGLQHDPSHALAGLNLVECLVTLGQDRPAVEQARRTLAVLDRGAELPPDVGDSGRFPLTFDFFRVEWERAAWAHAGDRGGERQAKSALLRWRLHVLLAGLTQELHHAYEAVAARPDLPPSRTLLGCALARAGRPGDALFHLRQAVADNPFDAPSARALFDVLGALGDVPAQRRLAHNRRLLARSAPVLVPAEPWFLNTPPAGDELASILILCCNQLDYTRQCLDSVFQHSRPPYELVLVDNGSTDGTLAYLEEVRSRPGPVRVEVIRNETNRGFPAGCNQALAQAKGRYLVFLNNDTVVTAGWLEGLIAWSLEDWPMVGLVGAVSNYTRPPQLVEAAYRDLNGLPDFAARRARDYARKAQQAERLTGFCLLARREVLDQLGGFDEQYGLGFFDDDDLSIRARRAGFQLLVALNVFVHHYGSRTFTGLGIDCQRQLQTNLERFQAKWGVDAAAGYQGVRIEDRGALDRAACGLASSPDGHAKPQAGRQSLNPRRSVSLCLIVKNEEHNLSDCLTSAADLVNEIIVVDTGSTDRTKEVAARFGAKVFDFPWVDSFAAARNETLRHATGDWIFWLDADDRLDADNREKLRRLFQELPDANLGFVMKCLCLPDPQSRTATLVDHVRLFRHHPELRWEFRIHEQILPALRRRGGEVRKSDVVIRHTGYQDLALLARKHERDLRLLHLEDQDRPDNPFTLFNLASAYLDLDRPAEALSCARRSLERSSPGDSIVRKVYSYIIQCHRRLGQRTEALAACQEGLRCCPDDAELLFLEGAVRHDQGDRAGAEACWLRLLSGRDSAQFASVATGLRGGKTRDRLAKLYREQGRLAEAEAQWRAALAEQPDFLEGWLGLGELCLVQQRGAELEEVIQRLETDAAARMEAAVLRACVHLGRHEYAAARALLTEIISQFPRAAWPRRILSHALLQEGRDPAAAEQALRDLLALVPDDLEARNNLALLLGQQGRLP